MPRKYQNEQLVRFTKYSKFGESDRFGYVIDYYNNYYIIRNYTGGTDVYMRTVKYIKQVTKEEEFLLFLERK